MISPSGNDVCQTASSPQRPQRPQRPAAPGGHKVPEGMAETISPKMGQRGR